MLLRRPQAKKAKLAEAQKNKVYREARGVQPGASMQEARARRRAKGEHGTIRPREAKRSHGEEKKRGEEEGA